MRTLFRSLTSLVGLAVVAGLGLLAASPAHAASQRGGTITRSEVISRAVFWYNERSSLTYNSTRDASTFYPDPEGDRYAPDCSGYVSMAWHVAFGQPNESAGGYNTEHLPDISTEIPFQALLPGDLINDFYHHAILFNAWESDHVHFSFYSFGSSPISFVSHASQSDSSWSGHPVGEYKFYRYRNIVDDSSAGSFSRPGVVLTSGGGLQVVTRGMNGELRNVSSSGGQWTDWGSITTGVAGNPAVTVGSDGNTVVVYRGTDGSLHEWWMDKTNGQWGNAGALAPNIASDPSVTVVNGGGLQVVARGASGELRNVSMNPSTGRWTDWGSITTGVAGDPAVTVGSDGNTVVLFQASDTKLHEWWMDKTNGHWGNAGAIGGTATITGDPAAAVDATGNLNVVAPGGNYTLQQAWMDKTTGTWAGTQTIATNIA